MAGGDHGYLKIDRGTFLSCQEGGCPLWNEPRCYSRWEAWVDVMQLAAYEERDIFVVGSAVHLQRGETPPMSLRRMALRWGWSVKRARSFLRSGKKMGRLARGQETNSGATLVIPDFERYLPNEYGFSIPLVDLTEPLVPPRETRPPDFIYLMIGPETTSGRAAKIGISNAPERRVAEVKCPLSGESPSLHTTARVGAKARELELILHRKLRQHNIRGEWFAAEPAQEEFLNMVDCGQTTDA